MTELDTSAWKLDDKAWKKERREAWNVLKDKIKHTTISRTMTKYLKQYFMEGVVPDDPDMPEGFLTFYKMWLHPDQSEKNLQQLFDSIIGGYDYRYCFKLFKEFGHNACLKLDKDGILNGNEEIFTRVIYPPVYSEEKIELKKGITERRCQEHAASFFSGFCVAGSHILLNEQYYRNEFRQFMIGFWFSVFSYGDLTRPEIDWLFRAVYYFDEVGVDDGLEGNRRRFAERMKEALDTREMPEILAQKWAWIKTQEGKIPTVEEVGLFKGWAGKDSS